MKTGELIAALAGDRQLTAAPGRLLARTVPAAVVVAAIGLLTTAGPRADLLQAADTPRFLFKFLATLSLAIPALLLLPRVAVPVTRAARWRHALWLGPLVLLAGVVVELVSLPRESWLASAVGHNALWCLFMVPTLATLPLAATLYCLRRAAPASPVRAGAVAGLASGSLAAMVYAVHCTDDSPLFVGLWYSLGVLFVSTVGAGLASRLARW